MASEESTSTGSFRSSARTRAARAALWFLSQFIEHSRQSLARYKVPRGVYIEEMLPKNAVGKVAKPVLRDRLS
jgi:non-ribosomal peptide synthetase component E (peptide arylation enzyme)